MPSLNLNGMAPLPPREDAERSMAFSMLLKYALTRPDGTPTNFSGIVTATFVHPPSTGCGASSFAIT